MSATPIILNWLKLRFAQVKATAYPDLDVVILFFCRLIQRLAR